MAKQDKSELDFIKLSVDFTYNRWGNSLSVDDSEPYDGKSDLSLSYKLSTDQISVYKVVTHPTGYDYTDYRLLLHEYGHIYLRHFDGIYNELNARMLWVLKHDREALIERINEACGIDYGETLLNHIIDDPMFNHSLHNIAMDMEVNTRVLTSDDVDEMRADIEKANNDIIDQAVQRYAERQPAGYQVSEDERSSIASQFRTQFNRNKEKLILPGFFYTEPDVPFEDGRTYPEYYIEIVQHLDQFIKSLVSIVINGGDGDTKEISAEQLSEILGDNAAAALENLKGLMEDAGMSGNSQPAKDGDASANKYNHSQQGDHSSPEQGKADQDLKEGKVQPHSGQPGCSETGSAQGLREVNQEADPIDMAIDEVMRGYKSRVTETKPFEM